MRCSLILGSIVLAIAGCSKSSEFPVAKASGKVLCEGQPVPRVRVTFGPVEQKGKANTGNPGFAHAGEDGVFVLSSYGNGDGGVVGKHNVIVSGPHPEEHPDFDCNCETDGRKVVQTAEIKAGAENVFTINLPVKTANSRPNVSEKDLEDIVNSGAE